MIDPNFDPLKDLVELKNFATSADVHIANLMKNEKEIVKAINELSESIKEMKQRLILMEKVLDEIARTQR